jgi:hypothetical protein
MITDLMFDLETLGTTADAAILSIGIAALDHTTHIHTFEVHLELDDQLTPGRSARRVDASTLFWWMAQDDIARSNQTDTQRTPVRPALEQIGEWLQSIGVTDLTRAWGNGADFDLAMLNHLYKQHSIKTPWLFWNHRCFRTLKAMFKQVPKPATNDHRAVQDAVNQLLHLCLIRQYLKDHEQKGTV